MTREPITHNRYIVSRNQLELIKSADVKSDTSYLAWLHINQGD